MAEVNGGMHVYNAEPIENYEGMFGNYYRAHEIVIPVGS